NQPSAIITDNLIIGNSGTQGGGIYWSGGNPVLVNNTVADNDSQNGSAIFADVSSNQVIIENNLIIALSGQTAISCSSPAPALQFNDVYSPSGTAYGPSCIDQTGSNGN